MVKIIYEIVPHDGGWAIGSGRSIRKRFRLTIRLEAVRIVVAEQQVGDEPVTISYQDENGRWREEYSDGGDRPEIEVVDAFVPSSAPSPDQRVITRTAVLPFPALLWRDGGRICCVCP